MDVKYITNKNNISRSQIKEYLKKTDNDFYPKLSSRVDITEYAGKIYEKAVLIVAVIKKYGYIGLTAFYANDFNSRKSYLSNINVMKTFSGLGIANTMMGIMENYLIDNGFKEIYLEVYNKNYRALSLYEKYDFKIEEDIGNFFKMKKIIQR